MLVLLLRFLLAEYLVQRAIGYGIGIYNDDRLPRLAGKSTKCLHLLRLLLGWQRSILL